MEKTKRITEKFLHEEVKKHFRLCRFVSWRSPSTARLSWDVFTIFDVVIVFEDGRVFFIQMTTLTNLSKRRRKIQEYFVAKSFVIPNSYIFAWNEKKGRFKIEKIGLNGFQF